MSIADKLTIIAENIPKVHEAGKKAEYDKMWDRIQLKGGTAYNTFSGVFNGRLFGFDNFYPKYDIRPVGKADNLFYTWQNNGSIGKIDAQGDLEQRLKECGVILDTSQVTGMSYAFAYGKFYKLPTIDCTGLTGASVQVFANLGDLNFPGVGGWTDIEKIITKESVTYKDWFHKANIGDVRFEGVIGNDIDFSWSKSLTLESIKSIISCLKDYSGTTTTKTLALHTNSKAKLTDAEKALITQKGWTLA